MLPGVYVAVAGTVGIGDGANNLQIAGTHTRKGHHAIWYKGAIGVGHFGGNSDAIAHTGFYL
jgi:hypothetical protein